jgi:RNA polymerase sigma-B factor
MLSTAAATAPPAPPPASHERVDTSQRRRADTEQLFARFARLPPDGAEHAELRDRLVEMHLPLVAYFARRYAGRGEPLDDLVQAGAVGLVKAVDRFDPERGVAFSTYAGPTVLGEIRRHFRDRTWAVHVQRSLQNATLQVDAAERELAGELQRSPTVAELSERTGLTAEEVVEALRCHTAYRSESLEQPLAGSEASLRDLVGSEDAGFGQVETHEALCGVLARLPAREQRIIQMRFFGTMTQTQIANRLGISQMQVSRLLARTLERIRRELTDAGEW